MTDKAQGLATTVASANVKTGRQPRRCKARAPASRDQLEFFEAIWTDYLDAAATTHETVQEKWMSRNCYTSSPRDLDASALLSVTVRLINAASRARLLQAAELFYDASQPEDQLPLPVDPRRSAV